MIGKITRGTNVGNLVVYLFGPGKTSVHEDPRVVAGFRAGAELQPKLGDEGRWELRPLISLLRQPVTALDTHGFEQPVWQCSLRVAPEDPCLDDDAWRDIAEDVLHRVGIVERGDEGGCRWIAVRHADDHVHLVVTLAREDGGKPRFWNDKRKLREACLAVEDRYGLRRTAPADRTATPRSTRGEVEKAARRGISGTPRQVLRRVVATAAAGSSELREFFEKLGEAGVLVEKRFSSVDPDEVTGYKVGLPGDVAKDGQQVWFSGGKLAPELSAPKLVRRWGDPELSAAVRDRPRGLSADERELGFREAARGVTRATQQFRWSSSPEARADIAAAASGVAYSVAHLTGDRRALRAADEYARAAREPYGRVPGAGMYSRGLRSAARMLAAAAGPASRRAYETTVAMVDLVVCLVELMELVAEHRAEQGRREQAEAARRASVRLSDTTRPVVPVFADSELLLHWQVSAESFRSGPAGHVEWQAMPGDPAPSSVRRPGRGR